MSIPISTRTDKSVGGNDFMPARVLLRAAPDPPTAIRAIAARLSRSRRTLVRARLGVAGPVHKPAVTPARDVGPPADRDGRLCLLERARRARSRSTCPVPRCWQPSDGTDRRHRGQRDGHVLRGLARPRPRYRSGRGRRPGRAARHSSSSEFDELIAVAQRRDRPRPRRRSACAPARRCGSAAGRTSDGRPAAVRPSSTTVRSAWSTQRARVCRCPIESDRGQRRWSARRRGWEPPPPAAARTEQLPLL